MPAVTYSLKNHISVITLNRPEAMNTFNFDMYNELNAALAKFRDDNNAWVAILTAAGEKAFSAGVDLEIARVALMSDNVDEATRKFSVDLQGEYYCDKPIIAAIQGHCIGEGLSTVLGCDLRIASDNASFALPEAKIGVPTVNAAIHGASIIGVSNILELLLLGEPRDADWAYQTGLVNLVVPYAELFSTAMSWAEKIATLSPQANYITKEAAKRSQSRTFEEAQSIGAARRSIYLLTNDAREGPTAFLEKRKPQFTGH